MTNSKTLKLIPIMFCFFAMGFVDLVGTASNYVKADLHLSDMSANIFPSLVFFWFLFFSVPTGMLMNKIGRKKTVLLSLIITVVSLLLPIFGESYELMLISFSLLGIGNALMQTSINPLVMTVLQGGNLAATFTFGQFIKAIASFLAPYIAAWGAMASIPSFGLGWRILFPHLYDNRNISFISFSIYSHRKKKRQKAKPATVTVDVDTPGHITTIEDLKDAMAALHGEAVITIKKIAFTESATADTDYQIDHFTQGVISVDVEKQLGAMVRPGWPSPACPPTMGDDDTVEPAEPRPVLGTVFDPPSPACPPSDMRLSAGWRPPRSALLPGGMKLRS